MSFLVYLFVNIEDGDQWGTGVFDWSDLVADSRVWVPLTGLLKYMHFKRRQGRFVERSEQSFVLSVFLKILLRLYHQEHHAAAFCICTNLFVRHLFPFRLHLPVLHWLCLIVIKESCWRVQLCQQILFTGSYLLFECKMSATGYATWDVGTIEKISLYTAAYLFRPLG